MTLKQELDSIRERAEKATKGPWRHDPAKLFDWPSRLINNGTTSVAATTLPDNDHDADFIASARSDVPKLLAVIDKLIEQRDKTSWGHSQWRGFEHKEEKEKWNTELLAILTATESKGEFK